MPSMFARSQDSSAAAVSKILRQLLDKELIAVSVAANDGRQRAYELTRKGKTLMQRLRALRKEAIDAIWADLPPEELRRFIEFADSLTERIEHYASAEAKE